VPTILPFEKSGARAHSRRHRGGASRIPPWTG